MGDFYKYVSDTVDNNVFAFISMMVAVVMALALLVIAIAASVVYTKGFALILVPAIVFWAFWHNYKKTQQ
jgi:Flp pilus assembly protein TadB